MKKVSRLSVSAAGFAILIIALDFAVIRGACLRPMPEVEPRYGPPFLPGMVVARLLGRRADGWVVFAFFLLPMINALLIGAYRLRWRGDHTVETVGYVIAGTVATVAVLASCLIWPETAIGMVTAISRPIALASYQGLMRLIGNVAQSNHALEWIYAVILAVLVPIACFSIPPMALAIIGAQMAQHSMGPHNRRSVPSNARPEFVSQGYRRCRGCSQSKSDTHIGSSASRRLWCHSEAPRSTARQAWLRSPGLPT